MTRFVLFLLCLNSLSATSATLTATYTGNYDSARHHDTSAYVTGVAGGLGEEHKGYVVFALSSIVPGTTITSAFVHVPNPQSVLANITQLDVNMYAVPGANYGNFAAPYADSSGTNFGYIGSIGTPLLAQYSVLSSDNGTTVTFALNVDGLTYLQSAEGQPFVVFAFAAQNLDPNNFYTQLAFNLTGAAWYPPPVQLELVLSDPVFKNSFE